MAAMCTGDEPSSVEAVENHLDAIQSLRIDIDAFAQKMRSKLSGMEEELKKQVEDLSNVDQVGNEMLVRKAC